MSEHAPNMAKQISDARQRCDLRRQLMGDSFWTVENGNPTAIQQRYQERKQLIAALEAIIDSHSSTTSYEQFTEEQKQHYLYLHALNTIKQVDPNSSKTLLNVEEAVAVAEKKHGEQMHLIAQLKKMDEDINTQASQDDIALIARLERRARFFEEMNREQSVEFTSPRVSQLKVDFADIQDSASLEVDVPWVLKLYEQERADDERSK